MLTFGLFDQQNGCCKRGDACPFAHGVFECWLHPTRYRTQVRLFHRLFVLWHGVGGRGEVEVRRLHSCQCFSSKNMLMVRHHNPCVISCRGQTRAPQHILSVAPECH